MEIAASLQKAQTGMDLRWAPREQNTEADEPSNGDSKRFDPRLEVKIDLDNIDFILLPKMFDLGEQLY